MWDKLEIARTRESLMKVLIALDPAPHTAAVFHVLQMRDWAPGTEFRLLSVVEKSESRFFNWASEHASFIHDRDKEEAEKFLHETLVELRSEFPAYKFETLLLRGHASESILQEAESWNPDLIVVGSRGTRMSDPLMLGSVSQIILEHASCPVVVARNNAEYNTDYTNVLLPMDHSSYSAIAAEWLMKQRWVKPLNLRIVSVIPAMPDNYSHEYNVERAAKLLAEYQDMERAANTLLRQWRDKFNSSLEGSPASSELLYGNPRETILMAASNWPAELIVMGSHGHTGITRFLLGSVSRAISANAGCSVEVVHTGQVELSKQAETYHESAKKNP